jgi:hypothetical protein
MIFGAYVTLAVLSLRTPDERRRRHPGHHSAIVLRRSAIDSSDLYSLRARRRFASYLRMRILELRAANLERAADIIEHRLPISTLLDGTQSPP